MSQKEIVVSIGADGNVVVEANNFKGVGCKAATEAIEIALGGNNPANKDSKPKPDYWQTVGMPQRQTY